MHSSLFLSIYVPSCLSCVLFEFSYNCAPPQYDILVNFITIWSVLKLPKLTWPGSFNFVKTLNSRKIGYATVQRFHWRDQPLCRFIGTKGSVYIRKEKNHSTLVHQHSLFRDTKTLLWHPATTLYWLQYGALTNKEIRKYANIENRWADFSVTCHQTKKGSLWERDNYANGWIGFWVVFIDISCTILAFAKNSQTCL